MAEQFYEERDSVRIGEYLWILFRHKWIILGILLASVAVSIAVTVRTRPVYQSTATFIYDASSRMAQTLEMSSVFWFEMDPMRNNQIQIIRSRSMAESVADSILRSPNSDSLVSLLFGDRDVPQNALRSSLISMVRSNSFVSIMSDTDFFVLSATGCSPAASATLANLIVQTYYRRNLAEARGENTMVKTFLAEQIDIIVEELQHDEDSLTAYKEEHGIISLSAETATLVNDLSGFETEAARSVTEQGALEAQRNYLQEQLQGGREMLAEDLAGLNTVFITQLENEIATLESSRASLIARGGDADDPAMLSLDADLDVRRNALMQALGQAAFVSYPENPMASVNSIMMDLVQVEALLRAERIREVVIQRVISEFDDSISVFPEVEINLARLERNRNVSEQIYLLLRTKYEEVRIAEAGQMGNVMIMDTALPGGMIAPNARKNQLLGIFAGLALGIGLVLLKEQLDQSVKNPEDIEALDIPVIGVIPKVSRVETRREPGRKLGLIMVRAPRQAGSESYRDLRTSLRFSRADTGIRTLLITSAGPQEGKSTTAGNLAVAIAQTGTSVLLVDTDLRRPVVHNIFGVPREPGVSEVIAGIESLEDAVRSTEVENLSILTCGFIPHNPSELIGSRRFVDVMKLCRNNYEMVIFDSPPVAVVTDAILIGPEVDATLMVVGAKIVNRKVLQSAWQKLVRSSANMAGAVLNGFDPLKMYTAYTYYTYRYHYYYEDGKKRKRRTGQLNKKKGK